MKNQKIIVSCLLAALVGGCLTSCCMWQHRRRAKAKPPVILVEPESQLVSFGSTATFTVVASNLPPFQAQPVSHQWFFNGAAIPGATTASLSISNVQIASLGRYFVVVSGPGGNAASENADVIGSETDPPKAPPEAGDPTGNSGTLTVGHGSITTADNHACFPNPPWDIYHPIVGYFYRGTPVPNPNRYPNPAGANTTVTVKTCDAANGTTLQTGIVIFDDLSPSNKKCVTNSTTCTESSLLTTNKRNMTAGHWYRAVVYSKASTTNGLQAITVKWSYP
jgi:hypothetical protein